MTNIIKEIIDSGVLSKSELSDICSVNPGTVHGWYKGKNVSPIYTNYLRLKYWENYIDNIGYTSTLDKIEHSLRKLRTLKQGAESDARDVYDRVFSV